MKLFIKTVGDTGAERLEPSTANPSMRVRAPLGADFSAHCEIKQSLNHFACSQVTGT